MILIEEDEDKVGEESCTENNEDTYKENKNANNKTNRKRSDNLEKPRAI